MLFVMWIAAGWCGTPDPGLHVKPQPVPWSVKIASIAGGVASLTRR